MRSPVVALVLALSLLVPAPAHAAEPPDFPTAAPTGHWFTQTNGFPKPEILGYGMFDYPNLKFWSEFQRLGGVPALGYPVSGEFAFAGFVDQATQKAILQWHPDTNRAEFLNVLDLLHDAGRDGYLQAVRQIPPPADTSGDAGKPWTQVVAAHQALLAGNVALQAAYFADPDPLSHYGLPMTGPVDEGNVVVVRCQRAALQLWKSATPWAAAGQVTIANGGDIAKELGFIPPYAVGPFAPNFAFVSGGPIRQDAAVVSPSLSDLPSDYRVLSDTTQDQAVAAAAAEPPAGGSATSSTPNASSGGNGPSAPAAGVTGPTPDYLAVLDHGLVNRYTITFSNDAATPGVWDRMIDSQVDAYRSVDGASWHYQTVVARVRGNGDQPVAIPAIGDESSGWLAHTARVSDNAPVASYGVVVRTQNITAIIDVYSVIATGSIDFAVQLARDVQAWIAASA